MAKGVNPGKDWCEMSKIVAHDEETCFKSLQTPKALVRQFDWHLCMLHRPHDAFSLLINIEIHDSSWAYQLNMLV